MRIRRVILVRILLGAAQLLKLLWPLLEQSLEPPAHVAAPLVLVLDPILHLVIQLDVLREQRREVRFVIVSRVGGGSATRLKLAQAVSGDFKVNLDPFSRILSVANLDFLLLGKRRVLLGQRAGRGSQMPHDRDCENLAELHGEAPAADAGWPRFRGGMVPSGCSNAGNRARRTSTRSCSVSFWAESICP